MSWLRERWWWIIAALFLSVLVIIWNRQALIEQQRQTRICQDAGYVGLDYVVNDPVCYRYVEGNQLIVKPLADVVQ